MAATDEADWNLSIAPNRGAALAAIAVAWGGCASLAWLLSNAFPPEIPGWAIWVLLAPFPILITWSGLKVYLSGAGTIALSRDGFHISDGRHPRLQRRWEEVEEFTVATAFKSPVYKGKEAPHVRFLDGSVDWLPQNGGYDARAVVGIMVGARRLAEAGWPVQPKTVDILVEWAKSPAMNEEPGHEHG